MAELWLDESARAIPFELADALLADAVRRAVVEEARRRRRRHRAVHRAGGWVVAQDEATSEHFGMPGAAILAGAWTRCSRSRRSGQPWWTSQGRSHDDDHRPGFRAPARVRPRCARLRLNGLSAADAHAPLREADAGRGSRAHWGAYRAYLEEHPDEFSELFNAILIDVTGFFRDKETWEVVAEDVIPKVLAAREAPTSIRVWSAGCASGEEPYTISMLLAEALGEEAYKDRVKIYATHVDEEALAQARDASYSARQLSDIAADLREKYFQPANGGFACRSDLRRSVIFGRNDLHKDPPISRVDLLVSRNRLMYFGPEIQERILANFYFALNRGGYLVVGKAEALQKGRRLFVPYNLKRRIFVKNGSAEPAFHVPRTPSFAFAPLAGNEPDATAGVILLLTADRVG